MNTGTQVVVVCEFTILCTPPVGQVLKDRLLSYVGPPFYTGRVHEDSLLSFRCESTRPGSGMQIYFVGCGPPIYLGLVHGGRLLHVCCPVCVDMPIQKTM